MKRKRMLLSGVIASMMLMQSSLAFADTMPVGSKAFGYITEDIAEDAEPVVLVEDTQEDATEVAENSSISSYATTTDNFKELQLTSNGQKYTLIANIAYSYTHPTNTSTIYATGAQITNIKVDSKTAKVDIVIPDIVTFDGVVYPVISIGETAFDNSYATSITVPSSVYEIKDRAFINCPNLKTVTINGADETPSYQDSKGKYYKIPTIIGSDVVANCPALTKATINGFETIGNNLFANDSKLTDVDIHINGFGINATTGAVTNVARTVAIGNGTFTNCSALKYIKLMDSVKTVGTKTFLGCTSLETVEIGETLTGNLSYEDFIDPKLTSENEFNNVACNKLKNFVVSANNKNFAEIDGILYNKAINKLIYCPLQTSVKDLITPDTLTSIDTYAAFRNKKLTSLVLDGKNALTIGAKAFMYTDIKSIEFNKTGKIVVGDYCFAECPQLSSVITANNHGGSLGKYAFYNDPALTSIILKGWVTIGDFCFANSGLVNVVADYGVGTIGSKCFDSCKSLKTVDLERVGQLLVSNGSYTLGTYIFNECSGLEEVIFPETATGISTGTFYNCTSLKKAVFFEDTGHIASNAFYNCTSLSDISTIKFLVKLDSKAFVNCTSLKDFTMTRSAKIFAKDVFVDCNNLTIHTEEGSSAEIYAKENNFNVAYDAPAIADYEFLCYYPVSFDSNGTRKVDTKSLYTQTELSKILTGPSEYFVLGGYRGGFATLTIPNDNSVYSTEMYDSWITKPLSSGCSMSPYLTSIEMGIIDTIGKSVISGSKVLENLVLSPQAKVIGNSAFSNCSVLKGDVKANALVLPFSMVRIGESAFANCTSLENIDTDFKDINSDKVSTDFKIEKLAFSGCKNLKSFNSAFTKYEVVNVATGESISIKYYLKEIGENAFKNCSALEKVYFNGNLEKIGVKAFENCTSLTAVTLDNSVLVQTNAFIGCTNLEGAIIVGEANVAVSNDPFCSNTTLNIATTDASKAQTYVDYKNGQSTNNKFVIELREFNTVNGKAYLKSYVNAPDNVVVYKNGTVMDTKNDYVIYTNELTFEMKNANPDKTYSFFVNGSIVGDKYTVSEFDPEKLVITFVENDKLAKGDVTGNGKIEANDSAAALQYALNKAALNLDEAAVKRADVNEDGSVKSDDSASILQKALISTFEYPLSQK